KKATVAQRVGAQSSSFPASPCLCGELQPSIRRLDVAEFDINALQLRVVLDRGEAVLASQAGLLVAAERHLDRGHVVVVEPAGPGLQPGDDPVAALQVAGKYTGGQPVFGG